MRLLLPSLLLLSLACGGVGDVRTEEVPAPPAEIAPPEAAPAVWVYTRENKQELVKAGTAQALAVGSAVVLLGPALAGTENRQIVGSAKVVEVWPDLARVETERARLDAPPPEAARALLPEDQATVDALPPLGKGARKATAAAVAKEFTAADLPADLRGGTGDSREEALIRYEGDASMTQAIVFVMKHDTDADVRTKAWRVVRARWKRGTGSAAEHEGAANWLASNGTEDLRIEAINAIAGNSRGLSVAKHLDDSSQPVRVAAAEAVFDIGKRAGKRAEAKKLLQDRLAKETVPAVKKKLADWIGEL